MIKKSMPSVLYQMNGNFRKKKLYHLIPHLRFGIDRRSSGTLINQVIFI